MKILAVDTATKSCSVAIIEAGSVCAELTTLKEQTHSKHLMELIHKGLGISGYSAADIDGLAVTIGPGSFTGLRIGVSTIKGLAHALDKPVVGISSLDVLAWQCADRAYLICPLLDARKGEVYSATYRYNHDTITPKSPENASAPEAAVQKIKEPCVFIGSGAQLIVKKYARYWVIWLILRLKAKTSSGHQALRFSAWKDLRPAAPLRQPTWFRII